MSNFLVVEKHQIDTTRTSNKDYLCVVTWLTVMSRIVLSFVISGLMKARLPEKNAPPRFQPLDRFVCQVLHL